jgi:hypothetical protein
MRANQVQHSGRGDRHNVGKVVSSVVTHIVRNYSSGGKIKLPNTTGGRAFKQALHEKGVRV